MRITTLLPCFFLFIFCNLHASGGGSKGDDDPGVGYYYREGNTVHYSWTHIKWDGNAYDFSFSITYNRGWDYMQQVYLASNHVIYDNSASAFVRNDPFRCDLQVLASQLRQLARQHGLNENEVALSFVQALPYDDNNHQIQRYAVETLIDFTGDCSDTAVLFAGILAEWNYDFIFLWLPDHMAIGLWSNTIYGDDVRYYSHQGRDYYFCETTNTGRKLGECPDNYKNARATFESPRR